MVKTRIKSRKIREGEEGLVEVDGVTLDAKNSEVIYQSEEKDIQIVASPDPDNENSVTIAVLTNSEEDVEDEKVLGSASVEGSEGEGAEEARKAARREAFRKRLEARRSEKKAGTPAREARVSDFRKRLEARRAEKRDESRKARIAEAREKFRSKIGKKA